MPSAAFFIPMTALFTTDCITKVSNKTPMRQDPTLADFNIFHHLDNAMLLEPDLLHAWPALLR